jgi:hypothetical protein
VRLFDADPASSLEALTTPLRSRRSRFDHSECRSDTRATGLRISGVLAQLVGAGDECSAGRSGAMGPRRAATCWLDLPPTVTSSSRVRRFTVRRPTSPRRRTRGRRQRGLLAAAPGFMKDRMQLVESRFHDLRPVRRRWLQRRVVEPPGVVPDGEVVGGCHARSFGHQGARSLAPVPQRRGRVVLSHVWLSAPEPLQRPGNHQRRSLPHDTGIPIAEAFDHAAFSVPGPLQDRAAWTDELDEVVGAQSLVVHGDRYRPAL